MKKKAHAPPPTSRRRPGATNAQAHGQTAAVCADIDGAAVADLVAEHGSPLYVFSEATLRRTCREARCAFRRRYPDVQFAWSYKTNYLKAVCAVFHQEGAVAEVVSDFEYEKARAMGVAGPDILFNGPCKPAAALERAVDEGAKVQIDNFEELRTLRGIAAKKKRIVEVAIRVYVDSGARPVWSKFGFNADDGEALQAVKQIRNSRCLRLAGLHTHVGTSVLDPTIYGRAAERLVELAEAARREYGFEIAYLNLGGGFASSSHPHCQDLPPESVVPSFDDYAEAICRPILRRWPAGRKPPRLYLETGRALVDEAGYLISTITSLKHGAAGCVMDAGIHLLPMTAGHPLDVRPARPAAGPLSERTLYGCLCMNIDVLRQSVALPNLDVGDLLVFHPVGAYNITQSMQFITYRPRVVLVTEDGGVEVIRERENLQHIEALERLPERLQRTPAGAKRRHRSVGTNSRASPEASKPPRRP